MSRHHTSAADQPIATTTLFAGLSRREVRWIAALSTRLQRPAGDVLAREGHHARQFIVILSGRALATVDGKAVAELTDGSHTGTNMLAERTPHPATITTVTPTDILAFSVPDILDLIRENPVVRARLETSETPHTTATQRPFHHDGVEQHTAGHRDDQRLDLLQTAMASAHAER